MRRERTVISILAAAFFASMWLNLQLVNQECLNPGFVDTRIANKLAVMLSPPKPPPSTRAAVIYAFSAVSPTHVENFEFFLSQGLLANSTAEVDYYFVFNGDEQYATLLPRAHPQIKGVYFRENSCYDMGAWIHVVRDANISLLGGYAFFVFINAGVRGPFYPSYLPALVPHWHYALTSLLTDTVKLVGTSINCGGKGDTVHPHVQSMVWATDPIGLEVILAHPTAFRCFKEDTFDRGGLIARHELGLSRAILQAGYNIASLLRATHGVDYRDASTWNCNEKRDPYTPRGYKAGLGLHFTEMLFFKTNRGFLEEELAAATLQRVQQSSLGAGSSSTRASVPHSPAGDANEHLTLLSEVVHVDIVITVYGAAKELNETLASIFRHEESTISVHIILIADGNLDGAVSSVILHHTSLRAGSITALVHPHRGYTFAVNSGVTKALQRAVAKFVVLLNSDVIVTRGWLVKLLATAMSDSRIGSVGPLSNAAAYQAVPELFVGNSISEMNFNRLTGNWTVDAVAELVERLSQRLYPRFTILNGFCILFKAAVFQRVGLFDEENFGPGYGEENDFAMRMTAAGFEMVVDDATWIYHVKSASFGTERRVNLSAIASKTIRVKHGKKAFEDVLAALKIASKRLDPLRAAIRSAFNDSRFQKAFAAVNVPLRILYLLPVASLGGGQVSVIQESIALRKLGAYVKVSLPLASWPLFTSNFPELLSLDIVCPTLDTKDLSSLAGLFDVVVATVYHTVARFLEPIHARFPRVLPAYYVQDHEPDFFPPNSNASREAVQSYRSVASMGGLLFAKTEWLIREVMQKQKIMMRKVTPVVVPLPTPEGIQRDDNDIAPLRVVALLRPVTPRRNAAGTYRILALLKMRHGSRVAIRTFGCSGSEFATAAATAAPGLGEDTSNLLQHLGVLNRSELGRAFSDSDVFIDLSEWQAFGRTSAEAMLAGCTAIVPNSGGSKEFVVDGVNALVVDTQNFEQVSEAVGRLLQDRAKLRSMQRNAATLRDKFSEQGGAAERLALFRESHKRWLSKQSLRR